MAINTSAFRRGGSKGALEALKSKMEEANKGGFAKKEKDLRFWTPEIDKAGNSASVIRFLPSLNDELPYVKVYKHAFQENGKWFIEGCPSTIGKECPVCEENMALWKSGDAGKAIAKARNRGGKWLANVLVVKDPAHPENEGKVFIFRFGKKIFDKINEAFNANPELGEEAVNPFDPFEGANFSLKTTMVETDGKKFLNYDKSRFLNPSELLGGDEGALEEISKQMHDLTEFTTRFEFKDYDTIKKRFDQVTKGAAETRKPKEEDEDEEDSTPTPSSRYTPSESKKGEETSSASQQDDDEDLAFFRQLANQ